MADGQPVEKTIDSVVRALGPTTIVTAALYYFGWVRTRAIADYFGIDPELLGYSVSDYVLRSVDTMVFVLVAGAVLLLSWRWWLARSLARRREELDSVRSFGGRLARVGLTLLPVGLLALIYYSQLDNDLIAVGGLGVALLAVVCLNTGERLRTVQYVSESGDEFRSSRLPTMQRVAYDALGIAALFGLVFLTANWVGGAIAQNRLEGLMNESGVVLTSQHELHLFQTREGTVLSDHGSESDPWRYRYGDLRLFAESNDRWFLLPADWQDNRVVHVVDIDETVRLDIDRRGR